MAKPPADESKTALRLWQGRRARGRAFKAAQFLATMEGAGVGSLPAVQPFRFGKEHAPLAPPLPRGYTKGGGGVAGVPDSFHDESGELLEPNLTNEERQWLNDHDMPALTPHRVTVLRRIQEWDAQVATIISKLHSQKVVDTYDNSCAQTPLFVASKSDSTSLLDSKARSRRRRKTTSRSSKT